MYQPMIKEQGRFCS